MANRSSLGHVYDQLKQQGYTEQESNVHSGDFQSQNDSPWFIQGLMGCGGWIAAIFLLGVIGTCIGTMFININENGLGFLMLIIGSIFAFATMVVYMQDNEPGIFVEQLTFIVHIAGHLLISSGIFLAFELWSSDAGLVVFFMMMIGIESIFIYLYPNVTYRFLAVIAVGWCLNGIAYVLHLPVLTSFTIGSLIITAMLIWTDNLPESWQIEHFALLQPAGYGAIISAFTILVYEVSNRYVDFDGTTETAIITAIILFMCLVWLEIQLLKDYGMPMQWGVVAVTLLLALATITTPGVMAGIIVVLLAFRRRNHILTGIAYLYLASFIAYYYYWLDVTLLIKSIILMGTGILLIVARLFLRRITIVPEEKKGLSA